MFEVVHILHMCTIGEKGWLRSVHVLCSLIKDVSRTKADSSVLVLHLIL